MMNKNGSHAVALKKDHDLSHHALIVPTLHDPFVLRRADAGYFRETGGDVRNDVEDLLSECWDELLGDAGTNSFDES